MKRTGHYIVFTVMTLASSLALAATGRILDEVEAQQADSTALGAEVELFKSIGMGIALALSQCEGQTSCKPNVNQEELQHLLDTMDKRINTLMTRQEQNQGDFTDVITAYVTERDRDRKSTRLNSSHIQKSRMPSSA